MLTLSFVAGCTMDERFEGSNQLSNSEIVSDHEIVIRATREEGPETKTARNEGNGAVLWTTGDAISLFYGSGTNGGSRFASDATELCDVTNFTGTITAITGGANISLEDTYFWGVYPYADDVACDGTYVTMTLPSQQTAVPGTFATGLFPSIGRSQGLMMGFYNVCGGWRFSVTKEGVRKVTLKSNGGELITGKVKVRLNDAGIPTVAEIIEGSDEVVLECPQGEYFEVGRNYYMVLLPGTMASGFTMTFETYTEEGVYNRTASTTINRSGFIGVTNLDNYLTTPYTQKTGNIPIPDANFKAYMVENFDTDSDGEISYAEALEITTIDINTDNISSIHGIEYCNNLETLNCKGHWTSTSAYLQHWHEADGGLYSIDLSNNKTLISVSCDGNQLTDLNISKNNSLRSLSCNGNQLTNLDVSNNTGLTRIECKDNALMRLTISGCTALQYLYCDHNSLTYLDITNNTALIELRCYDNLLTSLDVSSNIALNIINCRSNLLTSLDVSNNKALRSLDCESNLMTCLDVSNNTGLTAIICGNNQLASLDVSNNHNLQNLSCDGNQLTSLDVSNSTGLRFFACGYNQLTSLDVSNNHNLQNLSCDGNQLTNLFVSNNTALTDLNCYGNQLSSLDVSNNNNLLYLSCGYNQLTGLDVSNNTALTWLTCNSNQLTSLDVSSNTALTWLTCSPMNDSLGNNLLGVLFIAAEQSIPYVTVNRHTDFIPAETEIIVKPDDGGNESTGNEEVNP